MLASQDQRSRDTDAIREMSGEQLREGRSHNEALLRTTESSLRRLVEEHASMKARGDRHAGELRRINTEIGAESERAEHIRWILNEYNQRLENLVKGDLLTLPKGLYSSGDPINENPFSVGDARYRVWEDASHEAEEEWARLNSRPGNANASRPDALIDSVCERMALKFDIWAKRGVHIVWSDSAVRAYDQWLISYAEAWLEEVATKNPYGRILHLDDLLSVLRLVLTRRVSFWKAEARRYLAAQKADAASKNAPALKSETQIPPKRKRGRPPDMLAALRRQVIQTVAKKGFRGAKYCEALVKAGLSTAISWQKNEKCPKNYLQAFNHTDFNLRKKWRNRIANEKYQATRLKPLA